MPLFKRKPFDLMERPKDLEPDKLVYQIRFTKEIFTDYQAYLDRINLYRLRLWSCKVTGKGNLTYEEALVSEKCATEKVQGLPKELVAPALRIIQFSTLSLRDLADTIATKFQTCLFVGAELLGRKDDGLYTCKILNIVEESSDRSRYEVAWLDRNKEEVENTVINGGDLVIKKPPVSRRFVKSFIRESTYRNAPWVLHNKLARKHGIPTDPPEGLQSQVFLENGLIVCHKKKRKPEEAEDTENPKKKKKSDRNEDENTKYPIEDTLLKPGPHERPHPRKDFKVPMDCVGDLMMVWDFCTSFGRLLQLSPFSYEDFESAICHKDSNLVLIMEVHSSLLRLLMKESGEYLSVVKNKGRKLKITLINWTEYLCDFLEMVDLPELSTHVASIKRGRYGFLDTQAKFNILVELINHIFETDIFKEKLGEYIDEQHALGATKREEALEEGRKKREEKEQLKAQSAANGVMDDHITENGKSKLNEVEKRDPIKHREDGMMNSNGEVISSQENHIPGQSEETSKILSKKMTKKHLKALAKDAADPLSKEATKQLTSENNGETHRSRKEKRKEEYEREMEKRIIRATPLGKDRNHNRYWWFRRDDRIFVETCDSDEWGYYSTKDELDALIEFLNPKGEREIALQKQLQAYHGRLCMELERRSVELTPKNDAADEAVHRRSTRVRAPPGENPANSFLRYVNKWNEKAPKADGYN